MKNTLIDSSTISKQKNKSSRLSKKQNSRSNFQTDTNSKSKEKNKFEEDNLSNRIIKANIKFPNENSLKKEDNLSSSRQNIHSKVYEISVDKIFAYMKTILTPEIYNDIKAKFIDEFSKAMLLFIKSTNFSSYNIQYSSSISKLLQSTSANISMSNSSSERTREKNLKLSYDFVSLNKKKNNQVKAAVYQIEKRKNPLQSNNETNASHNLFSYSSNNNSSLINKKHSLYTLTKSKMLYHKTTSNSKSKSNSREQLSNRKKLSNLKQKQTGQKTNSNNNFIINSHLFNKINKDLIKTEKNFSNEKSKQKPHSKNIPNSTTNSNNINIKISHNRNTNLHLFYINNYINNSNNPQIANRTTTHSRKKDNNNKQSHKSPDNIIKTNIDKKSILKHPNETIPPSSGKTIKIDNITVDQNEKKTNEQLREIKSSLDDNLKVMFNFSYEGFLNKESESESKKSFDNNNTVINNTNDNEDLNTNKSHQYFYKTKYDY